VKKKSPPKSRASSTDLAESGLLKEAVAAYKTNEAAASMVRTQVYLSKSEYDFLQSESRRRGEPMAAVIRSFIDEKMTVPEQAWEKNPLLDPPADDSGFVGHEDGAVNHDHYIYGGPKKYQKVNGQWVWKPLDKE